MTDKKTYKLVLLALLTALTVVLGFFFKLPTPTGLVSLLDVGIFFAAFYLGRKEGAVVGALSGFMIDLLAGYPQWMFFSLLFHGAQGFFAGFRGKWQSLGLILSALAMVGGYACSSAWMHGWGAALPEILPNFMQNLVGLVLGGLLAKILPKNLERKDG